MAWKYTSEVFQISAGVIETAPNTFAQTTINLNLDSLSREILIIQYCDLNVFPADLVAGFATSSTTNLSDTSLTNTSTLANSRIIAVATNLIEYDGVAAVVTSNAEPVFGNYGESPLFITATDDLFLSVKGNGNVQTKSAQVRIWARRARADADTYAAILTSQFN
jgi:hypothetical protein